MKTLTCLTLYTNLDLYIQEWNRIKILCCDIRKNEMLKYSASYLRITLLLYEKVILDLSQMQSLALYNYYAEE